MNNSGPGFLTVASSTLSMMLSSATPVALAALGGLLTEHAGIMNIGMDGMILMGAFVAAASAAAIGSAMLGVLAAILFGVTVGLFFALFVVKLRSDEFIIGCALNTLALGLTGYFARAWFGTDGVRSAAYFSKLSIPLVKDVPFVGDVFSGHSAFVYVTWLLVVVMWLFVYRTPTGFWIRAAGESPETLRTAGKNPERMKWIASILCGVFCGLAGAYLSLGNLNGTFVEGMSDSRGYIAFACVIFSAANPLKAYLAALMFGFFDALGGQLQGVIHSNLPYAYLTKAIPYVITVVMMVYVVVRAQRRRGHIAKQQLKKPE
jgi:simple sugar transport system permease protein